MQNFPKTPPDDPIYEFGPFRLVPSQHLLLHATEPVRLTPKVYDLLHLFVTHHGQVVSHADCISAVWAGTFVEEANLTVSVSVLRRLLRRLDPSTEYIATIPKRGYRFVPPVREVQTGPEEHLAGSGAVNSVARAGTPGDVPSLDPSDSRSTEIGNRRDVPPEQRGSQAQWTGRHASRTETPTRRLGLAGWSLAAGAVAACTALGLAGVSTQRRPVAIGSIAVLPFDFSGAGERAYFADILTEELTTSLAQLPGLRITSRRAVSGYRVTDRPIDQIAHALNVNAVVHGAVRVDGEHIRVTAQLVRATDDSHMWAGSYTDQARDIVTVPAEMARAIAREIRIKITAEQQAALDRSHGITPDAYEAFLRGLAQFNEETLEGNASAIAQFKRAITLAPAFDRAYAALAQALGYRHSRFAPTPELEREARAAIQKALEINPRCAEAYVVRAGRDTKEPWSHPPPIRAAIDDLHRALAINPSLALAHFQLGFIYMDYGLFEKASAEYNAALALDPEYPQVLFRLPRLHLFQQEYQTALEEFQKSRFTPNWHLPIVLSYLGRQDEALAAIEAMHWDYPFDSDVAGAYAVLLAKEGRNEEAERQIRTSIERGEGKNHFHYAEYDIGSAYALMSQPRRALEWFRRAAADGTPCYPRFAQDPNLNRIRDDSEFRLFLEGLRRQWEELNATL
jgi:DNA-binding winged helix-turn-helix (wHTH) protein/TolB-like protein